MNFRRTLSNAASSRHLVVCVLLLRHVDAHGLRIVPELFVAHAIFVEDDVVCPPHRLDLEETIHALKGDTLGLRQKEEDEDDRADHHGREEEVDTAAGGAHGVEHLLGEARDDEIPEPVRRSCRGLAQGARVVVKDLTVDDPRSSVPAYMHKVSLCI